MSGAPEKTPELSPVKRALLALDDMQARLRAAEGRLREPLAVIGMSCRFPGGAGNPARCWELLRAGTDAVVEVPPDRWDVDAYYDPDPSTPGKMSTRWGGFLDRVDEFDAELFGISPREAQTMDPQQRLLLETTWEALECAGQAQERLAGSRTGVFVGISGADYAQILSRNVDSARIDAYFASGVAHSVASGRLSYFLGLRGPSVSIDTACSSSLVAVHQACQSVRARETDLAIAAGVNLVLLPDNAITFSKSQMMAADGRCKTFDARADGFVRAEGCGVVIIKRLADALAAGDPILAVIRGTAANQDGASSGLTAPSGESQEALLREALTNAGVRPDEVGYIETHGTGTSLGDPIEVRALGKVFGPGRGRDRPLVIGSIKSNFGHQEACAGIAGLIKAVLCLQQREIPPNLHFETPNPHIAWEDLPLVVPRSVQPFPARGSRYIAGVSSFGFSGTNAHVILEAPPERPASQPQPDPADGYLLTLSAKSEVALREQAARYRQHLLEHPELSLADVCYTANVGRSHLPYRLAVIAKTRGELLATLANGGGARGQVSGPSRGAPMQAGTAAELAEAYVKGARIDWVAVGRAGGGRTVGLPSYPFQRQRYWVEEGSGAANSAVREASLLGRRLDSPALDGALFASTIGPGTAGEFALDHRVFGVPILPGTGYVAMAVAAACSLLGDNAVELKQFVFHEALPVPESGAREVQLVARTAKNGTVALEVFSRQEDATHWTLHAATTGATTKVPARQSAEAFRGTPVPVEEFYRGLVQRGLDFGPLFRGVEAVSVGNSEARGEVVLPARLHGEATNYPLHPVLLDACLQIAAAAASANVPQDSDDARTAVFMPLEIASVRVRSELRSVTRARAHARITQGYDPKGQMLTAQLDVYDDLGHLLASFDDIRFKKVGRATLERLRSRPGDSRLVELAWEPDTSAIAPWSAPHAITEPIRPDIARRSVATGWQRWDEVEPALNRICRAYIVQALRQLGCSFRPQELVTGAVLAAHRGVKPAFTRLLDRFLAILEADGTLVRGSSGWTVARVPEQIDPDRELETLSRRHAAFSAELTLTRRFGPQLAAALTGGVDPLQLLFPGGDVSVAAHLYRDSPSAQLYQSIVRDTVAAAVKQFPVGRRLRVLEIGGGTASATTHIVPVLPPDRTEYLFTDISPLFTARAAQQFAASGFVTTATLNIENDPRAQGITGEFDLVIAGNVLHATRDLAETLRHVRQLLAPGGLLLGVEITRPQDWIDLSFGFTEGWWRFADTPLRPDYPLLAAEAWKELLLREGFDEVGLLPERAGNSPALSLNVVFLARLAQSTRAQRRYIVLAERGGVSRQVVQQLRESGSAVCVALEGDAYSRLPDGSFKIDPLTGAHFKQLLADCRAQLAGPVDGVLSFWGVDCDSRLIDAVTTLREQTARIGGGALHLAQALLSEPATLWLFTRGGVSLGAQPVAPLGGILWGWSRSLRLEHPEVRCVCVDLDPGDPAGAADAVLSTLARTDAEDQLAWRGRSSFVARLRHPTRAASQPPQTGAVLRLNSLKRGVLENLALEPVSRRPPGPAEVEVRVRASGLNFRDVLCALDLIPQDQDPLGSEFAGRVTAVGAGVQSLRVGDDVLGIAVGAFATYLTTPAALVIRKPRALTFAQAASLPNVLLTANWALNHLGQLRRGERVLIHAAAGGVGLAAIRLAQRAGAEIFATAGSQQKRAYLRSLGVEHVFDSRTLDFVAEIRARTAGRGVDLVLNSLAGDFIPASFSVLDRRGRFLEIGKAGIWTQEQARASHPEVQYHVINLSQDYATRPEVIRPMLSDLVESVARGELALLPLQTFPLSNAVEAFRLMAQARHVGKVVLTQPWTFTEPVSIRPDATYLVTGGLSGLGLAVAGWLAARGARHLLLMGRRAPNANAAGTIATLEGRGVRVVSLAGDVSTESDVLGIGAAVRDNNFPRLAGVVHAAGALDDGIIESQSIERYARVFAAKTDGSWLLERACGAESLDFFIAFSSVAAVFGSAGQTNHAAANAYMDLLTARMREAGQPAMSIQWGAWSQIGAAAGADLSERLQQRGLGQLSPAEGLAALEEILGRAFDQVAVVSADWSRFARQLPPPARRYFGALIDTRQTREEVLVGIRPITGEPAQRTLVELLRQAPVAQRRGLLQEAIRANACKVLSLPAAYPIDAKAPLAGLGLDSLMAVELRNLLGRSVGRNLPATLLFDYPTLDALAGWLMTTLELEPVAPIAAVKIEVSDHDLLGSVESLSEAELDVLLKAKLGTR